MITDSVPAFLQPRPSNPPFRATSKAERLEQQWRAENAEIDAYEARLHTQPDGTRTLSKPEELDQVTEQIVARYRRKTPAEVRKQAEHWRYMADRVYSKVVDGDEDIKRIEQADAIAKALERLADERQPSAPVEERRTADLPGDEYVWVTPAEVDPGDEEAGLVWRGADAADYASRLEDALSARKEHGAREQ